MTVMSSGRVGCAAAREQGICENRRTIKRSEVEERILTALSTRLMNPELFATFCETFVAESNRLRAEAMHRQDAELRELAKLERELERIVDAIADGVPLLSLRDRLGKLEDRKSELLRLIAAHRAPEPVLHPRMATLYRNKVADLAAALNDETVRPEASEILRGLNEAVVMTPEVRAATRSNFAARSRACSIWRPDSKKPRLGGEGLRQVKLDAGARNHHNLTVRCSI